MGEAPDFTFHGPRLGMRPWRADDLPAFHAIFGDERVIWWGRHKASLDESRAGLAQAVAEQGTPRPGLGRFAVVAHADGRVVGNVILRPADFEDAIEVGYHVMHAAWGRGYATEAARATLDHGFGALGLERIVAAVALKNGASLRVMDKLGMRPLYELDRAGLRHRIFELRPDDAG